MGHIILGVRFFLCRSVTVCESGVDDGWSSMSSEWRAGVIHVSHVMRRVRQCLWTLLLAVCRVLAMTAGGHKTDDGHKQRTIKVSIVRDDTTPVDALQQLQKTNDLSVALRPRSIPYYFKIIQVNSRLYDW